MKQRGYGLCLGSQGYYYGIQCLGARLEWVPFSDSFKRKLKEQIENFDEADRKEEKNSLKKKKRKLRLRRKKKKKKQKKKKKKNKQGSADQALIDTDKDDDSDDDIDSDIKADPPQFAIFDYENMTAKLCCWKYQIEFNSTGYKELLFS